jgi:ABC-2 type transport system ATP-binding protein
MTAQSYLRFFADLYEVPRDVADVRITDALDRLDLEYRDERKIGDMSKGMKRKVAIARALVNDPKVLIFDEPASGLDPVTTNYVIEFTKALGQQGKTIVFSAHNLHQVEEVCDRVIIMNDGEIVARGTIEEIREDFGETTFEVLASIDVGDGESVENGYLYSFSSLNDVDAFRETVNAEGGHVVSLRTREDSLETIFLNIVGEKVVA